jgi:hypothetical protein
MIDEKDSKLKVGRVYTAEELGSIFGFSPYYLRAAGGMVPASREESLLLITHAGQESSFEYGDYWDRGDLIYTGRGQNGDQILAGPNLDVAENRRKLWIFAREEKYQRRYLGHATCIRYWWAVAPDKNRVQRRVLKFCLRLDSVQPSEPRPVRAPRLPHRRPRPFDETAVPKPPSPGVASLTPEEIAQLNEKASTAHHMLLAALKRWLVVNAWADIEEIPSAVDLWARHDDVRVIFEAKTITSETELVQTRAALAQLLEYRFFYGTPSDHLCLIAEVPLSDRRLKFLSAMGVLVLCRQGERFILCEGGSGHVLALMGV